MSLPEIVFTCLLSFLALIVCYLTYSLVVIRRVLAEQSHSVHALSEALAGSASDSKSSFNQLALMLQRNHSKLNQSVTAGVSEIQEVCKAGETRQSDMIRNEAESIKSTAETFADAISDKIASATDQLERFVFTKNQVIKDVHVAELTNELMNAGILRIKSNGYTKHIGSARVDRVEKGAETTYLRYSASGALMASDTYKDDQLIRSLTHFPDGKIASVTEFNEDGEPDYQCEYDEVGEQVEAS